MKKKTYSWWDVEQFSKWVKITLLQSSSIATPEVVVGILNGGAVPALIVANIFKVPLFWVKVKSYIDKLKGDEVEIEFGDISRQDVHGKAVWIVDELIDSGDTVRLVWDWLQENGCPMRIDIVVMINKCRDRKIKNFRSLFDAPADVWCVMPWEGGERSVEPR